MSQERTKKEMSERHERAREDLSSKMDTAARKEEQKLLADLDAHRDKMLKEKRNKQAAELAARPDLSEAERQAVSRNKENK